LDPGTLAPLQSRKTLDMTSRFVDVDEETLKMKDFVALPDPVLHSRPYTGITGCLCYSRVRHN
jgi:hypothetical protein